MKRDKAHEVAVKLFEREHSRWVQNALVIFAAYGALFTLYIQSRDRPWFVLLLFLVAMTTSVVHVFVGLSIRRTTDIWGATIREIEAMGEKADARPFNIFKRRRDEGVSRRWRNYWNDLWKICHFYRSEVLFSVTRIYTAAALLLALLFLVLFLHQLACIVSCGSFRFCP